MNILCRLQNTVEITTLPGQNLKRRKTLKVNFTLMCEMKYSDFLTSYITNWAALVKICEENHKKIDTGIYQKVSKLSKQLKPIATALNVIQKNTCIFSEAVAVWKKIQKRN